MIVYNLERSMETMDLTWRESSESSRNTAVGESAVEHSRVILAKGLHARRALCPDLSRAQSVVCCEAKFIVASVASHAAMCQRPLPSDQALVTDNVGGRSVQNGVVAAPSLVERQIR